MGESLSGRPREAGINSVVELDVKMIRPHDLKAQLVKSRLGSASKLRNKIGTGIKVSQSVVIALEKDEVLSDGDIRTIRKEAGFRTRPIDIHNRSQSYQMLRQSSEEIVERVGRWIKDGSNWRIASVLSHKLVIYRNRPLGAVSEAVTRVSRARSGSSYIELPPTLRNPKKGLINIQNKKDEKCFLWCHVRFLKPALRNPNRVTESDRKFAETLVYDGISFPVKFGDIPKIEDQNNIKVNVFGHERGQFFPLHIGKVREGNVMNLLLISDGHGSSHYVLIKSLNSLFYCSNKHGGKTHFCHYCIQGFSSADILERHKEECIILNGGQATKLPEEGSKVKFQNYHKQLKAPFIIYADFESILKPTGELNVNKDGSYTDKYDNHECCGFAYKVVSADPKYTKGTFLYRGKDAVRVFLKKMMDEESECQEVINEVFNKPLIMTKENLKEYARQKKCHICGGGVSKDKVKDHCHITGEFRGAAHSTCNSVYRLSKTIPVVFHNLRGYDAHFLVLGMGGFKRRIGIIPNNFEKYMSISWGRLRFIDSFQFMSASLGSLVDNLPSEDFHNTNSEFSGHGLAMIKRKGVYPYEYFDSHEKFNERRLPPKEAFFSKVKGEGISDEDYKHARNIWSTFKMKTLGNYHDLYLQTDVLLLADVFEKFRRVCLETYKLDPAHYVSSPGLSWDAMLRQTNVELELVSDTEKYLMIERGMRGGVSCITHRYAEANNELADNYDSNLEKSWLIYLDANNLYGWAMSQPLPTGGFRFLSENEIGKFDPTKCRDSNSKGYYLEVDLHVPNHLHDYMSDYPVAPEKMVVTDEMLSGYSRGVKDALNCDSGKVEKLLTTLLPKKKYVLHHENLRLYLSLGAVMTRIHRVIEFNQSPFLKDYIDMNTRLRGKATNDFEKNFYKLMNNAVYGKTCENLRKRVDIKLVNSEEDLSKMVNKPTFVSAKVFSKDLIAVHRIKKRLLLNKPSYIGCAILDISKCLMYDFHYNWVKKKYGNKAQLLFTDTDSLAYKVRTENIYQDMWDDRDKFDLSGYTGCKYFLADNKKVIGKMKDECGIKIMQEFIGLRSKMYSYKLAEGKGGTKRAKGVSKSVVENRIGHDDYRDVLERRTMLRFKQYGFRTDKHKIYSCEMNKISLSCFDDKRYILDDGITTLPYGHHAVTNLISYTRFHTFHRTALVR